MISEEGGGGGKRMETFYIAQIPVEVNLRDKQSQAQYNNCTFETVEYTFRKIFFSSKFSTNFKSA